MSNTDGEDTQRCKFNCDGPKSELDQFCGCWNELHQELASLREQLKKEQEISQRLNDDLANALDFIEKKEDENRELMDILQILQPWISGIGWIHHNGDFFNMNDRIEKAKNLSA